MNIDEVGLAQVEEGATFHENVHNDIKKDIVKEEPSDADIFVKDNFDDGTDCVHLVENARIADSKQDGNLQVPSVSEDVKLKVENTQYDPANEPENPVIKLIDTIEEEEYFDSPEYLPTNIDFGEYEAGQAETEDEDDIVYDNKDIEEIKAEFVDYEASLSPINESQEDCGIQLYRPMHMDKTDEAAFQCKVCLLPLSTKNNLSKQENTHTCEGCLKSSNDQSSPVLVHSTKGWCTFCYHRGHLVRHDRSQIIDDPFYCKVCSESFSTGYKLVQHEKIHAGHKPFICKLCLKSFYNRSDLVNHKLIHTAETSFAGKIPKAFSATSTLANREQIHSEQKFECKFCSKSFTTKYYLSVHERIHAGKKRFQCDDCSKSFFTKNHLEQHQQIHTGQQPYVCKVCSKSFSSRSDFVQHQRIYTRDTRFECKVCLKLYSDRSSFVMHELTHNGEKRFHCNVCTKSFVSKPNLGRHQRIHTREKPLPFKCKVCSRHFSNIYKLRKHKKLELHTRK